MGREIYRRAVAPHNMRVATDAGIPSDNVQAAILLMQDNLEWVGRDKFMCISPELFGAKIRTSAPYQFATKGYSANNPQSGTGNDLTQSTANSQPYLSKIAPSEPQSLKNQNGDSRFMSHPAISFAANEKWTVEVVLNWNGGSTNFEYAFAGTSATSSGILFRFNGVNRFAFNQLFGLFLNVTWDSGSTNLLLGKSNHIALVYDGSFLELFINSISLGKKAWDKTAEFSTCLSNIGTRTAQKIHHYYIIPDALSASRIAYRAALLRSMFAEIPTVRVAGLDVAVRALDVVCTPAGNLIPNVTDNSAWAALTTPAWAHHSNDLALGSVYGKIYNGYSRTTLKTDLASSNFGYHIATKAELTAIAASGLALKVMGTAYWTTANGTNVTGLTLLGGASRSEAGTFNTIKATVSFWCDDVDECFTLNDNGTYSFDVKDLKFGAYVLLIKNY